MKKKESARNRLFFYCASWIISPAFEAMIELPLSRSFQLPVRCWANSVRFHSQKFYIPPYAFIDL